MPSTIKFTLIDRHPELIHAWEAAFAKYVPEEVAKRYTIVQSELARVKPGFDCIVSPANSYGLMDGGCVLCKEWCGL